MWRAAERIRGFGSRMIVAKCKFENAKSVCARILHFAISITSFTFLPHSDSLPCKREWSGRSRRSPNLRRLATPHLRREAGTLKQVFRNVRVLASKSRSLARQAGKGPKMWVTLRTLSDTVGWIGWSYEGTDQKLDRTAVYSSRRRLCSWR